MTYENQVTARVGEKFGLQSGWSAGDGTATISSAKFYLTDHNGTIVTGFNGVDASREVGTAASTGEADYILDTSASGPGGALSKGVYYAYFTYTLTGSDSLIRVPKPDIQIALWPVVEKVATYDPGNFRGRVRDWLRDKAEIPTTAGTPIGIINPIWSDGDVDNFIAQADASISPTQTDLSDTRAILLAASIGWEQSCGDAATVAIIEKIAIFSDNTKVTYDAMKDYAMYLRSRAALEVTPTSTDTDHVMPDFFGQVVPYNSSGRTSDPRPLNTW